ncbi:MAG: RDD family protein [Phycisphaerales bacterium]|nr:RDD family protein [Phycisphaerales bacterium]
MKPLFATTPTTRDRRPRMLGSLLAGLLALALTAAAQTSRPFAPDRVFVASDESYLWIGGSSPTQSLLLAREASSAPGVAGFDVQDGHQVFRPVANLAVMGKSALLIFDNGGMYRFTLRVNDPMTEANVPGGAPPIDLGFLDDSVFAIVPSAAADRMITAGTSAPYSLVEYRGTAWRGVARIDEIRKEPPGDLPTRVGVTAGELFIVWSDDGESIHVTQRDRSGSEPKETGTIAATGVQHFWFTLLSGLPSLVSVEDVDGAEKLVVRRLLPASGKPGREWRATAMEFSPLPGGRAVKSYKTAVGFNQHLALLAADDTGEHFVQFARAGEKPLETSFSIDATLNAPLQTVYVQNFMHMALYAVLIFVMVFLFWFRRDSVLQTVTLPPDAALALAFQRLLGWLIDFAPIAIVVALVMGVEPAAGVGRLFDWGIVSSKDTSIPPRPVLVWWAVSVSVYVAYALLMELLVGRTLGKMLVGTRVLGEQGDRPRTWQVITRNLMRIFELFPHFWIFAFIVLLSRNRQRLGDVFGRTVVVRKIDPKTQAEDSGE